jgi:adenylate kinase
MRARTRRLGVGL